MFYNLTLLNVRNIGMNFDSQFDKEIRRNFRKEAKKKRKITFDRKLITFRLNYRLQLFSKILL